MPQPRRYAVHHITELTAPFVYANGRGPWIVKHVDDTLDQVDNWLAYATEAEALAAIEAMERDG